jgi:sugar lactone lactonase YvrE
MRARAGRAAAGLIGALLAVASSVPAWSPAGAQTGPADVTPPPGSIVVSLRSLGQVNAVLPSGEVRVLARGLVEPTGVVVLADRTVLVAESGANRVSGFGGRFGSSPQHVATVAGPSGLALRSDGTVFVSAAGEVGQIEFEPNRYRTIATGFVSPTTPAAREGVLYVPDSGTGEVVAVDIASGGKLAPVATGLRSPGGAASAPGLPLFVSESAGNSVVRVDVDAGTSTPFATAQGPLQLTIADPSSADGWSLVAATAEGIVRFDPNGRVLDRVALPATTGAAAAPGGPPADGSSSDGDTIVVREDGGGGLSPLVVLVGVVVLAAIGVVVLTMLLARRARHREQEGHEMFGGPSPAQQPSLVATLGRCAAEERDVDRLEHELRSLAAQLHDARRRWREAVEQASRARDRAMRALEVRTSVRNARLAGEQKAETYKLDWTQLSFTTDAGREALSSFQSGAIDANQLRDRLTELGELNAVAQIVAEGQRRSRSDPSNPWPEERQAVHDAVAARDELRVHEHDAEQARIEVAQWEQREQEVNEELADARRRLDECLAREDPVAFNDF